MTDVIDSLAVLPLENLSGDPNQEYFSDGMTDALITELSPGMKDIARARIAIAYARLGDERKSQEMLDYLINLSPTHYVSPIWIAIIYASLEDIDQAFEWLEKAYHERCDDLPHLLKTSSLLDTLRPDPRFQDLMKRMRLDQ